MTKLHPEIAPFWVGGSEKPPRKSQIEAMNWMVENKDARYLILEMPVGAGKSLLGMTFSRYRGNSAFALTPQIILQKQYEDDFSHDRALGLSSFYGKSNYPCAEKGVSCALGSLTKPRCSDCPYQDARDIAQQSNNAVMNYKLALSVWAYTKMFRSKDGEFRKRRLAILDEAHTLEQSLVQFDTVVIDNDWCYERGIAIPSDRTIHNVVEFIKEDYNNVLMQTYEDLMDELEFIKESKNSSSVSNSEAKKTKELNFVEAQLTVCASIITTDIEDIVHNYVLVSTHRGVELKRLYAKSSFKNIMQPTVDQMLFLSSTILDKNDYCHDLGINPDEAKFLSLESEFDPENRSVVYMPRMKMNYGWDGADRADERKTMLGTIEQICDMHPDDSGIIHTGNFKIAQWLCDELKAGNHEIIHHNPNSRVSRNDAITSFIDSSVPSILISPSSTEGLDLKDDLARFAIFAKVPFGNMGDAWIKKRQQISNAWYARQALIDMIQGGGRIVRTPDDYGTTFILDGSFGYLFQQNKKKMPKWWLDAYSEI